MNKKLLLMIACLCALMLCIATLAACNGTEKGAETDTGVEGSDTTEAESDGKTSDGEVDTSATEAATAIPRYDYFEADVSKDVTIDKSVYEHMSLTLDKDLEITDQTVTDYINQSLLFNNRVAVNGTTQVTDQALKIGDSAFIYYRGVVDGKDMDNGSNMDDAEPYELGLGSGSFIPGFEDGLVGVVPNRTSRDNPFELKLKFPDNYGSKELAGKDVTFYVVVSYSVQYTLPTYNKDFVVNTLSYEPQSDFYASDKALLQEFEKYVKDYLEENNQTNIEYAKTDALWIYLTGAAECRNLNQDEINFYYDSYVSEIEYYFSMYSTYYGDSFTALYPDEGSFAIAYMGLESDKDWKDSLKEMATKMVQKDMITHAIGEAEGIETVTDEQVQEEIEYWVDQYQGQMTAADVIQNMGEIYLRESAYAVKMSEWLMERATFTFE